MKLSFYGADQCVTGSCHCLEVNGKNILIDCGLQQGRDEVNNEALPFHPGSIDFVLITHAHIDHAGGTSELAAKYELPIIGPHEGDQFWIDGLPQQSSMFGFPAAMPFTPTRWLHDGDQVQINNVNILGRQNTFFVTNFPWVPLMLAQDVGHCFLPSAGKLSPKIGY